MTKTTGSIGDRFSKRVQMETEHLGLESDSVARKWETRTGKVSKNIGRK